jgi:hypothetical protein
MTITLSTSAAAVATPPADAAEPEAPAADGDHAAPALPAVDALAAFGATHGLHKDVQRFAAPPREALPAGPAGVLHTGPDGPGSGAPVAKPEVAGAIKSPPTKTACKALPQTYDVNATTPRSDRRPARLRSGSHGRHDRACQGVRRMPTCWR